ncbi:elongation factor P [Neomoorella thermoacetica]|uniref:Elongation factor P n=2 Tax=Neomoorella thermoacetica TaxID=1525 RepID=EFP_MOOTA|nr:elongation factor P [Moorella thermoacetica]Q2RI92.1 RecName: Full=Elongation factor P; Short=EF-P [Moorella thermoacetica ATCC 39073]MDN5326852.1 elongation factor [Moorella sp. (in: firmicutes)]AKX94323.1 elongation factor P [Moorella thermoacetica]AKX96961.1 elongation factor P [Moorella thermoacetica]AOQ24271.1 Elongation factor P [Moorella thermoacetica]APC08747.1 elongation factor P [Moorella thermoacetica]
MISTNDFRTGLTIEVDGDVYTVVEFMHVKPGKGSAFVRTKLKNRRTGAVIERTFRAGEKVNRAHVERREMQYLYNDGDNYYFMDTETFEQLSLRKEQLEDAIKYLKDNMNIFVLTYNGETIGIELPNSVELKVVETEPGIKGDTATGGTKNAVLETGAVIQVPLFIETGDVVRIDTRTGEYIERA